MLNRQEWMQLDTALDTMQGLNLRTGGKDEAHLPIQSVRYLIMAFVEGAVKNGKNMTLPEKLSEAVAKDALVAVQAELKVGRRQFAVKAYWNAVEKGAGRAPTQEEIEKVLALVFAFTPVPVEQCPIGGV